MQNIIAPFFQIGIFFLFLSPMLFAKPVCADCIPGYENGGIRFMKMWVQTHTLIMNGTQVVNTNPATGNSIPGDATAWCEIRMDIQNGKILQRIFSTESKPVESDKPILEVLQDRDNSTTVNHTGKTLIQAEADPRSMDSASLVYAGRVHGGNRLATLIEEASAAGTMKAIEGGWSLETGAPYFTPPTYKQPIRLELDQEYRPVRLTDDTRFFTFEWKQKEPEGFWYVQHTGMETRPGENALFRFQQWVREIEIDPAIPKSSFEVPQPQDYTVHDLSKRLRSPLR